MLTAPDVLAVNESTQTKPKVGGASHLQRHAHRNGRRTIIARSNIAQTEWLPFNLPGTAIHPASMEAS